MRQQINLVNLSLLPPKPFFQLHSMVTSLGVVVLACAAMAWLFDSRLGLYVRTAELAEQRVAAKQARVKAVEAQLAQRQKDPQAAAALLKAQEEQLRLQQIAASLQNGGMEDERRSYAAYFRALAEKPLRGIWLTRIEIHGPRMMLEGMAMNAEDIPPYLEQLQQSPVFGGQRFQSFSLGRKSAQSPGADRPVEALVFRLEPVVEGKTRP